MFYAHRLVAEAYIPNPNGLPVVNHKDENKLNNNIDNLEQVSYKLNNDIHNLRKISLSDNVNAALYEQKTNSSTKRIGQYSLDGKFIQEFPSIRIAADVLGLDASTISKVCRGKNKTHGGYIFKYF